MSTRWSLSKASPQTSRVAIVTGANTGLGYETAFALAGLGARVILACRNQNKAEQARQAILAQYPDASLDVRHIDTGSLASVRRFAEAIRRDYERLDWLINNAGIMITPYFTTEDGFEGQLGVNYLGHFLLTGLLLPLLNSTAEARVVSLYSVAANWHGIQFHDLQFEQKYDANKAYSQSKLACLMFGLELDKRLKAAGMSTRSLAAHPGYSQSDLSRHLPWAIRGMLAVFGRWIMQPSADGALPTLYAALGDELTGGEAIGPAGKKEIKGPPTIVPANSNARDSAQRERLWTLSESLCGIQFP